MRVKASTLVSVVKLEPDRWDKCIIGVNRTGCAESTMQRCAHSKHTQTSRPSKSANKELEPGYACERQSSLHSFSLLTKRRDHSCCTWERCLNDRFRRIPLNTRAVPACWGHPNGFGLRLPNP